MSLFQLFFLHLQTVCSVVCDGPLAILHHFVFVWISRLYAYIYTHISGYIYISQHFLPINGQQIYSCHPTHHPLLPSFIPHCYYIHISHCNGYVNTLYVYILYIYSWGEGISVPTFWRDMTFVFPCMRHC